MKDKIKNIFVAIRGFWSRFVSKSKASVNGFFREVRDSLNSLVSRMRDNNDFLTDTPDSLKFLTLHIAMAVAITIFTLDYAIAFSGYAFAYGKILLGITIFILIDHTILRKIKTFTEIKNGNVAVAIMLLAFAILIGGALGGV